jgi:hypothetical protein
LDTTGIKRVKIEKRMEVNLEDSEEEGEGSFRRRSGRLAGTRYK